jgi:hypothetical protein
MMMDIIATIVDIGTILHSSSLNNHPFKWLLKTVEVQGDGKQADGFEYAG